MIGEGGAAHVVQNWRTIEHGKPTGAIWHQALPLGAADGLAQVGFWIEAIVTAAALWRVKRNDMIAGLQAGHTRAAFHHDPCALMAQNRREQPLGISARKGELIRVANTGGFDFHQNLAGLWALEIDLHDFKWFAGFHGHRSACSHPVTPRIFFDTRVVEHRLTTTFIPGDRGRLRGWRPRGRAVQSA